MSTTLQKSVVLDFTVLVTDNRSRNAVLSDRVGALVGNNFDQRNLTIMSGEQILIAGIEGFLLLKATAPIKIYFNDQLPLTAKFLAISAPLNNLRLFNDSGQTVTAKLLVS